MSSLTSRLDRHERNLIINGNFDFWQRGTSLNLSTTFSYIADRFGHVKTAGYTGTSTATRSTDVPTVAQSDFQSVYSILVTNGTGLVSPGASDIYVGLETRIEGNDYVAVHRKNIRLQFWVKSSVTGTFYVSFVNSANDRSYLAPYTVSVANTWEKKVIDLVTDSSGTWLFDNGVGLRVRWALSAGTTFQGAANTWQAGNFYTVSGATNWAGTTSATFQIAQVMLIPGSFASTIEIPFLRCGRSIGSELAMCQRYYWRYSNSTQAGDGAWIALAQCLTTTSMYARLSFPVQMRTTPTLEFDALSSFEIIDGVTVSTPVSLARELTGSSVDVLVFVIGSIPKTVNTSYHFRYADGTAGLFAVNAEL